MSEKMLSEEDMDYLEEMMNIGAGSAAGALEQILQNKMEMGLPAIHIVPPREAFSVISDPSEPVTCVRMKLIGGITGEMFFIVPQAMKAHVADLALSSSHVDRDNGVSQDTAIIEEIGNILAGVYLTAIHDFCKLNIYHTIPFTAQDMARAVLDETIARSGINTSMVIIIVNVFMSILSDNSTLNTFLILVPAKDSEKVLLDSIKEARKICGR
jgi:chemotaxis protein CheC